MRILLLNQYGPGDSSPTGRLVRDLAVELEGKGWKVRAACAGTPYEGRRSGWERQAHELLVHGRLFVAGMAGPRPDVVLSLTSPACLVATASLVSKLRGARHFHWAMDLYPDLALALGEIREGLLSRVLRTVMQKAYQSCFKVVALEEDMRAYLQKYYATASETILPWPDVSVGSLPAGVEKQKGTWLYSGNLGRAHEYETLLEAQALLEKEDVSATLVFQGSGAGMDGVRKKAAALGLRRCVLKEYAPQADLVKTLLAASVLIVTRNPETKGMLWPSKLALLRELPRPLLWVGETDSHVAEDLKKRPGTGVFAPGQAEQVKNWLLSEGFKGSERSGNFPDLLGLKRSGLEKWKFLLDLK